MEEWLGNIKRQKYRLPKSAAIFEPRRVDSVQNMKNGEPGQLFYDTVRFGDHRTNVFRLHVDNLPTFVELGVCYKELSRKLNRLYEVPVLDVCTFIPYSVENEWARDRIMEQLSSGTGEMDLLKRTALVEELFIDPRRAAHRMIPFAKVAPASPLSRRQALLREGFRFQETDNDRKVDVWSADRPRASKLDTSKDRRPVPALDDTMEFPALGGGK